MLFIYFYFPGTMYSILSPKTHDWSGFHNSCNCTSWPQCKPQKMVRPKPQKQHQAVWIPLQVKILCSPATLETSGASWRCFFFFLSKDTWITRPSVFRPQMLNQWGYQRMGQKFKAHYKEFSHFWCHPFISNRPNFDPYPSGMKQLRFKHLNFMFLCCNQLPLIIAHGNP